MGVDFRLFVFHHSHHAPAIDTSQPTWTSFLLSCLMAVFGATRAVTLSLVLLLYTFDDPAPLAHDVHHTFLRVSRTELAVQPVARSNIARPCGCCLRYNTIDDTIPRLTDPTWCVTKFYPRWIIFLYSLRILADSAIAADFNAMRRALVANVVTAPLADVPTHQKNCCVTVVCELTLTTNGAANPPNTES